MDGQLRDGVVEVGGNARQQFHDARGYGTPAAENTIKLSRVEAAHLLFRGDLDAVVVDGERYSFGDFFSVSAAAVARFALRFLVYVDLRDRGFYLSPARTAWPGTGATEELVDLIVPPRGSKPGEADPQHRIAVVSERESIPASELGGVTVAVVDEESEISYLETRETDFDGGTQYTPPDSLTGSLIGDRVIVWEAPESLYEQGFYGQPLAGREAVVDNAVQLSLVEAAQLAAENCLTLDRETADTPAEATLTATEVAADNPPAASASYTAIREQGRAVEGERFDRRLAVYRTLRDSDVVPKTGYKFGADFRTYETVESVSELPHSECLVRVVSASHTFDPRALSLDVRLAGGVRKRMVFALTAANESIEWLAVSRLTP